MQAAALLVPSIRKQPGITGLFQIISLVKSVLFARTENRDSS